MTDETKRTRRVMKALEKLFAAEVDSALNPDLPPIAQIGPSIGKQLVAEGLAETVTVTLPGHIAVKVSGHALTEKGRMVYCTECADEEDLALAEAEEAERWAAIEKAAGAAGGSETP